MNNHDVSLNSDKDTNALTSRGRRRKVKQAIRASEKKRRKLKQKKRNALYPGKMKWVVLGASAVLLVTLLVLGIAVNPRSEWTAAQWDSGKFAKGISVNETDLSGLTAKEALERLEPSELARLSKTEITFVFNEKSYIKSAAELGISTDLEDVLMAAMLADKDGALLPRLLKKAEIRREGAAYHTRLVVIAADTEKAVADLSDALYSAPTEPVMVFDENADNDEYIYWEDGAAGIALDAQDMLARIRNGVPEGMMDLGAVKMETTPPKNTAETLSNRVVKIAEYTTSFYGVTLSEENRVHNIVKMADALNGSVIAPEEEWSFNSTSGERNLDSGWRLANTLYGGVLVEEMGGGVCQVSTTVYNAFLLAETGIIERHAHSRPSSYVPIGLDATVDYGVKDLKIINTLEDTLYLVVKVNEDKKTISAMVYGPKPDHDYQVVVRALIWQSNIAPDDPPDTVVAANGFAPDGTFVPPGVTYAYPKTALGSRYKTYRYYYPPDYDEEKDNPYSWVGYIKGDNASGEKMSITYYSEDGTGKDIVTYYPPIAGTYYINPKDAN